MMENTILIVGAGNFGAASALELAKSSENVRIILVDTTPAGNPRAASHDINKIIRDDYPDTLYMRMMLKAMKLWRSSPLYKPFFHEVGMLRADTTGFSNDSMKAYNELGAITRAEWLTVQEVRARWNGCFATTDFDGLGRIMYNPGCGWAEADKALNVTIQAAIDNGVEYEVGEVTKLIIEGGSCLGVQLRDGRDIMADSVLLCAGARTAVLLADSAPNDPALQAGTRVLATGAVSFYGTLEGAMKEKFTDVPVLKSCLEKVKGESMSMTPSGTVKFNCDMCFTNFVKHEKTGQEMSIPPQESHYATWTKDHFPQYLKDRCMNTMKGLYGDDAYNIKIEEYRMCWDATTPSHDFLICPHPSCKGLYIATGGSFHGWKFLPVLGEYIVKMIRGTLDQDYTDRWAWDKKRDDGKRANPTYQIEGDLKDWT